MDHDVGRLQVSMTETLWERGEREGRQKIQPSRKPADLLGGEVTGRGQLVRHRPRVRAARTRDLLPVRTRPLPRAVWRGRGPLRATLWGYLRDLGQAHQACLHAPARRSHRAPEGAPGSR